MIWLITLATAVAFGLGFALSWIRLRRRLQARINEQVELEIRRQINTRVADELSQGPMRSHIERAAKAASAEQVHKDRDE